MWRSVQDLGNNNLRKREPLTAIEEKDGRDAVTVAALGRNKFTSFGDMVYVWIYRYNLNTALYMLEPWERFLFNVIVLVVLAYIAYGLYYSALHPLFDRIVSSPM